MYDYGTVSLSSYAAEKSTDPNASADSSAGYDQVVEEEEAMPVSTDDKIEKKK